MRDITFEKCSTLLFRRQQTDSSIFFLHRQNPITTDEFWIDGKSLGPGTYSSDAAPWKMRNGRKKHRKEKQQGGDGSKRERWREASEDTVVDLWLLV